MDLKLGQMMVPGQPRQFHYFILHQNNFSNLKITFKKSDIIYLFSTMNKGKPLEGLQSYQQQGNYTPLSRGTPEPWAFV